MIQSDELAKLYKIRRTVHQMLEDRNYIINLNSKEESLEIFKEKYTKRDQLSFLVQKEGEEEYLYVEFSDSPKIGVSEITTFGQKLHNQGVTNGLLILRGTITSLAKQTIKDLETLLHLEVFEEKELIINITEHELVPKHYILSEDDKKALLAK